jgi:hypothetical protein
MSKIIEILKKPRIKLLEQIQQLSLEQLNQIPAGFNNNIMWNLGHIVSTQQNICYKRGGLDPVIDEGFFLAYVSGTKPEKPADQYDLEKIYGLFLSTIDRLETDINADLLTNYKPWTTRYGVEMSNINDVLSFLPFHDGLHYGTIMALQRIVAR